MSLVYPTLNVPPWPASFQSLLKNYFSRIVLRKFGLSLVRRRQQLHVGQQGQKRLQARVRGSLHHRVLRQTEGDDQGERWSHRWRHNHFRCGTGL